MHLFFFSHLSPLLMCHLGFHEALLLLGVLHNNNIVNGCNIMKYNKNIIFLSLQHFVKHSYKVAHKDVVKPSPHKINTQRRSTKI